MVSDSTMSRKKNILPIGLYGITAEKFSLGRNNIEVVQQMMKAGVEIIQYREKRTTKSCRDILQEGLAIRRLTQDAGVTFIVNDYVDIALLTDADGVHVGQDDLPVTEVRKLLGRDKIIGLSTHSPEQAREAVKAGADYIGVGPIFATATKDDVCAPVGFDYLDYVAANISLPFVAIGGIKRHNIAEVKRRGAQTICLVTEIVGAPDVAARIAELHEVMQISA